MGEDIDDIESWAQIFTDPDQLSEALAISYDLAKRQTQADFTTLKTEWDNVESFKAGSTFA